MNLVMFVHYFKHITYDDLENQRICHFLMGKLYLIPHCLPIVHDSDYYRSAVVLIEMTKRGSRFPVLLFVSLCP